MFVTEEKQKTYSSIYFSHQSQNRLADLVAEHLDHLHYLNDILCLNITDLNQVLADHLLNKLLIPLYICSLTSVRRQSETTIESATQNLAKVLNKTATMSENNSGHQLELVNNGRISCVIAVFLLSQVFLIISHAPLIQTLAWIILKTDKSLLEKGLEKILEYYEKEVCARGLKDECGSDFERANSCSSKDDSCGSKEDLLEEQLKNITDEEKQLMATTPTEGSCSMNKPFLDTIFNALDCSENDYTALFALSLLYALANNKGVLPELLEHVLRPKKSLVLSSSSKDIKYSYSNSLVDKILNIVILSCQPSCRVRLVTLELALKLLVQLVMCDGKNILTEAHRTLIETAKMQSTALLRNFYKSEEIFLDMFEHE